MDAHLAPYAASLAGLVGMGGLYLLQAIIADVVGIRAGHVPGMPVASGHDDLLFRATRAQANTNESLPALILLNLSAVLLGASPRWTNGLVVVFVAARLAHMLAYYADLRTPRSAAFAVGFACLVGLFICAAATLV